jgi:hypothetical protein
LEQGLSKGRRALAAVAGTGPAGAGTGPGEKGLWPGGARTGPWEKVLWPGGAGAGLAVAGTGPAGAGTGQGEQGLGQGKQRLGQGNRNFDIGVQGDRNLGWGLLDIRIYCSGKIWQNAAICYACKYVTVGTKQA